MVGLALLFWAVFLAVSLHTYSPLDPSLNRAVSPGAEVHNLAGPVGSYTAGLLVDLFGIGAALAPILFLYLSVLCFAPRLSIAWWRWAGLILLGLCLMTGAESEALGSALSYGEIGGGGLLGGQLFQLSRLLLRGVGAALFWIFLFLVGVQLAGGVVWSSLLKRLRGKGLDFWRKGRERTERHTKLRDQKAEKKAEKKRRKEEARAAKSAEKEAAREHREAEKSSRKGVESAANPGHEEDDFDLDVNLAAFKEQASGQDEGEFSFEGEESKNKPAPANPKKIKAAPGGLPPLNLLTSHDSQQSGVSRDQLQTMADNLIACLADFGIKGEVTDIKPGPVVTMFEVKPAPGTKISRISNLADDLALAMKALAVRIDAIPGSDAVGVEIPNEERQTVFLKDVFAADSFGKAKSKLTMALGEDIQGTPFTADLAKMPHLLVAGATGAGKSVCINTILMSFLYKASPEEVKLLLVDPKRIELAVYADLPHLVHPVVTEMGMAKSALEWAVAEMDRRYQAMATLGVRNIEGYNEKLPKVDLEQKPEAAGLERMPFLVIVIDELADLMMTAGKEAEMHIVRLAQLARAAGIHLILATQRPSVDVVTGLIKANFPSRLSFQVTSKHDSRTILDMPGAERLLGRGDSLFKPSGGKVRRVHGAFVDEDEIEKVVSFWKARQPQEFAVDFEEWAKENSDEAAEGEPGALDSDPLYQEAVDFVSQQGKASISLIQRRFRIGFNRAARFIEQMEMDGMLGPQEGSKPRPVIKGRE
ncbi:DNA translocase FtsK [Desulfohalovibrio reitneri]|uniref:DNA translocase FtsK n=1 Tax=Desulfohalovibrio reitneri TaxID=1307759 RepID=UPI0004A74CE8|nr:DNA translocase FtsK [Desulfohalovibrio reitneri]